MVKYRNIARDINCSIKQYRCWISDNYPGIDGYGFYGSKSGINDFVDYSHYSIKDGYTGDFLFPLAENVQRTRYVLPNSVDGASIFVYDGYVYLFGGMESNKILRASINDPNIWVDTGATLPVKIYASSLVYNNMTNAVYLLGGCIGDGYGTATDNVYYANLTNILAWSTASNILQEPLSHSKSLYLNNTFYLFGGKLSSGFPSKKVYRSSLNTVFGWIGSLDLPEPIHSTSYLIDELNNRIYLFGGESTNSWSNKIYSTTLNLFFDLTIVGTLPYNIAYSNSFIIGNTAYIYTHVSVGNNQLPFCRILKCPKNQLSSGWVESESYIENNALRSNLAILDDRIYLFGGFNSTNIQTCDQKIYYYYDDLNIAVYDQITTQVLKQISYNQIQLKLGFNNWSTNYSIT